MTINDLTTDELIWLEEELAYGLEEFQQPKIAYTIHEKILSIIDSRCTHPGVNENSYICKKCGELF